MRHYIWGDSPITQEFAENPAAYARFGYRGHNGLDIGCWSGARLCAPEDGVIAEAGNDATGYGLTVYLNADSGRGWRLAHFSALMVTPGQRVSALHLLGLSGNTGNSSGPHLHIGMRPPQADHGNGYGGYVDPLPVLTQLQEEADMPDMQGIIDELNGQAAALRAEVDGINGINTELGKQVNSLSWLLSLSQGETHAQAAEVARLQSLLAAPGDTAAEVEAVEVRLSGGKVAVLTR